MYGSNNSWEKTLEMLTESIAFVAGIILGMMVSNSTLITFRTFFCLNLSAETIINLADCKKKKEDLVQCGDAFFLNNCRDTI